ncbi:hypothetical protein GCM10018980_77350 [Streptomyces capoamus]|uniref:DUF11 domain-containing protein n=1 Tax=Streptomyces capoamus TaxID=68183 RepID=A0A919F482_9ACTN|nr:DUF11 domain-containing protein [Streptomyces capoamus]GHG78702.1 hypothetical protein GCM10018980_77350 [Streptomyces capoamus]
MQEAQFPIVESFTHQAPSNPHWTLLGTARLNGSLELTADAASQAGTAFLDQPFSSSLGVTIDFDYAVEGSSDVGDGFCLYVIDGARTTAPGGHGAALGYSYTKQGPGGQIVAPGVTGGFVGIGFDNHGNFSSAEAGPDGPGPCADFVGVRGCGNEHAGFRWLTGVAVPGGFRASWEAGAHLQVSLLNGRLTVRHSHRGNPNGTLLIDDYDLAGAPGQEQLPATFKLGFAAGTGSATAAHRIRNLTVALPVNMPLELAGPQTAQAGDRITYSLEVQNLGPNDAPDAVVEGTVPPQLSDLEVSCRGENGAACGSSSVDQGLHVPVSLPPRSKATITLAGTIDPAFEGRFTFTGLVESPTRSNVAERYSAAATTDVERPLVSVGYEIVGQWSQTWPEDAQGWLVSYDLKLAAREHRVVRWEILFDAPPHTRLNPTEQPWYTVVDDGTGGSGSVIIRSPGDGHAIEPGTDLTVNMKLLYPSQGDAGDRTLRNLRAMEITRP